MKKIIALILALCMSISIVGCKKKEEGKTAVDPTIQVENQTLKIHCYNLVSTNPLDNVNEENLQMFRLIFESLVQCDSTQKAQPSLASSWSVSSDGMTWTVNLKSGVKWHDGTEFSARDVVYTYNYVIGNSATSAYAVNVANIDSVSAVSDYSVSFKLKAPQANFINLLEIPVVKQQSGTFSPVGTGPYVYKGTENKIINLAANESWHKGAVSIKNIQVKILPDKDTATYSYVSKEIDIVSVNSGNDMGKYTSNSDNAIADYTSNNFNFIGININSEPLSNRMFRKAIAHAIDKEAINSQVLLSHGSVANSCMNSKWWVYNPGVTVYEYSKDKAVNVLNDVKKNMKLSDVTLLVNNENSDKAKVAEMIQKNLADCGITMHIEYVDWAAFAERISTGNYQMYLGTVKYSSEINPQYVITNPSAELQKLFVELQAQTTDDGVLNKYCEIQEKIAIDIHIIPLYFDVGAVLYNKRMEGTLRPCKNNIFNGVETMLLTA